MYYSCHLRAKIYYMHERGRWSRCLSALMHLLALLTIPYQLSPICLIHRLPVSDLYLVNLRDNERTSLPASRSRKAL